MVPNPMTGILIRRGKFGHRETEGKRPWDEEGRAWSDAATNQGNTRIAGNQQKLLKRHEPDYPSLRASRSN